MKIEINLKPKGVIAVLVLWAAVAAAVLCLIFAPQVLFALLFGGVLLFFMTCFSCSIYSLFAND